MKKRKLLSGILAAALLAATSVPTASVFAADTAAADGGEAGYSLMATYPNLEDGPIEAEDFLTLNEDDNASGRFAENTANDAPTSYSQIRTEAGYSGGKSAQLLVNSDESRTYTIYFNVAEAGDYDLEIGAACYNATITWNSPVKVTINGQNYGYLGGSLTGPDPSAEYFSYEEGDKRYAANNFGTYYAYVTSQDKSIPLDSGQNKISFTFSGRSDGQLVGGIDYVKGTKHAAQGEVEYPNLEDGPIEAEDFLTLNEDDNLSGKFALVTENSEVASNSPTRTALSGRGAVNHAASVDTDRTYTMYFNVAEAGDYDLEIGASCVNEEATFLSPMKVTINGQDYGYLGGIRENGVHTPSAHFIQKHAGDTRYEVTAGGYYYEYISKESDPIPLNSGLNKVSFTVCQRPGDPEGSKQVVGGIDYITGTKHAAQGEVEYPNLEDGPIEAEDFLTLDEDDNLSGKFTLVTENSEVSSGSPTRDTLSGRGAANHAASVDTDRTYTMYFNVAEAGDYDLEIGASCANEEATFLSPMKVTINGQDYGYLGGIRENGVHMPSAHFIQKHAGDTRYEVTAGGYYFEYINKASESIPLNSGRNKVSFTVCQRPGDPEGSKQVVGGIDYITGTKRAAQSDPQYPNLEDGPIEAEDFLTLDEDDNASGKFSLVTHGSEPSKSPTREEFSGKGAANHAASLDTDRTYTMYFNVAEEGRYNLEIGAACMTDGATFISPMKVTINGQDYGYLGGTTVDGTYVPSENFKQLNSGDTRYEIPGGGCFYFEYVNKANKPIPLSSGLNKVSFTICQRPGDPESQKQVVGGIDYIIGTKYEEPDPDQPGKSSERFEGEDVESNWSIVNDANVSGGAMAVLKGVNAAQRTLEFEFEITTPGMYNLNICAANSGSAGWISPMDYQLDDGEAIRISSDFPLMTVLQPADEWYGANTPLRLFRCGAARRLEAGPHKVTVNAYARNDGLLYALVDYIEVREVRTYEGLHMEVDNGYVPFGSTSTARILNAKGQDIISADIWSELSYTIADPNIARTQNGALFGLNYGKTSAKTVFTVEGSTYTLTSDFYVTDEEGLALKGASYSGGTLRVDVVAMKETSPTAKLFAYVCAESDGMLHSIKGTYEIPLNNLAEGEQTLTQTISAGSGDAINLILMDTDPGEEQYAAYQQLTIR